MTGIIGHITLKEKYSSYEIFLVFNREMKDILMNSLQMYIRVSLKHQFLDFLTETPTAKARWVLEYLNFQYITNNIKTNLFLQDFY